MRSVRRQYVVPSGGEKGGGRDGTRVRKGRARARGAWLHPRTAAAADAAARARGPCRRGVGTARAPRPSWSTCCRRCTGHTCVTTKRGAKRAQRERRGTGPREREGVGAARRRRRRARARARAGPAAAARRRGFARGARTRAARGARTPSAGFIGSTSPTRRARATPRPCTGRRRARRRPSRRRASPRAGCLRCFRLRARGAGAGAHGTGRRGEEERTASRLSRASPPRREPAGRSLRAGGGGENRAPRAARAAPRGAHARAAVEDLVPADVLVHDLARRPTCSRTCRRARDELRRGRRPRTPTRTCSAEGGREGGRREGEREGGGRGVSRVSRRDRDCAPSRARRRRTTCSSRPGARTRRAPRTLGRERASASSPRTRRAPRTTRRPRRARGSGPT